MNALLDLAGALLSLCFRVLTAPLVLLLFVLLALVKLAKAIPTVHLSLPASHFRRIHFHFPMHWKRKLLFLKS